MEGVCKDLDFNSMKLCIEYCVFEQTVTKNSKYLSKYCHASIPSGICQKYSAILTYLHVFRGDRTYTRPIHSLRKEKKRCK